MLGTTANSVMVGFTETEVLAGCPPELVEEAARSSRHGRPFHEEEIRRI
jgi:hypothetical protein